MSTHTPTNKKHCLHHQRQFRLYIGNGNWVTLPDHITNDLLDIYKRGVATRYHVAPGLAFDIIPNDMDCNSKSASLPKLMRVDLCYEGADSNTIQERLSRWVKQVLEAQGTVDAFPPPTINHSSDRKEDNEPPTLPRVMSLEPHRHLHLVPSVAGQRRTSITYDTPYHPNRSLTTSSDNNLVSSRHIITPSNKQIRIRRRQQSPYSSSTACSFYWTNVSEMCNDSTLLPSFRERQQLDGSYDAFLQLPHGSSSSWPQLGDTISFSSHERQLAGTDRDAGGDTSGIHICDGDLSSFPNWSLIGTDNMDHQESIVDQRDKHHLNPLLAHTPQEPAQPLTATMSSLSQSSPPTAVFLSNANGVVEQSLSESHVVQQCSVKGKENESSCTRVLDTA